jgi:hypothetical protein
LAKYGLGGTKAKIYLVIYLFVFMVAVKRVNIDLIKIVEKANTVNIQINTRLVQLLNGLKGFGSEMVR